ncbi:hypothetical protein HYH03_009971 [Edaphochlamys debaryana]|uniref:Lon N-terminal domain-containing protein n=1 Tax=Edaphochlamys debaryana TaxID=47281 RepID=A0A835Y0G4_9CHLO|nr:hypothetical protein HYH03_009971 [Edaphochlamys debaryana]|eukprot:KAG2491811.1 hypothetical protein HYH03_009971 [Edaphochlamys debaryana]
MAPTSRRVSCRASSWALDTSLFPVSLFPSHSALLPTGGGTLHIYEPHFLQMFEDLQVKARQAGTPGTLRFGHLLSPRVAPPALMEGAVGGVPSVGVLATATNVTRRPDGTLTIEYEGGRRIKLLSVWQTEPYMVAAACHMSDDVTPEQEDLLDDLEAELYGQLREVSRLSRALADEGQPAPKLPDAVGRYAPPPRQPKRRSLADVLTDAGHPAGMQIAMWQRHGSVYGSVKDGKDSTADPYSVMSERLGKDVRQELFSFAAALMLELGPAERLALLTATDRAARLQWVAAAVAPYLEEQRARASVAKVLGRRAA